MPRAGCSSHWSAPELTYRPVVTPHYWREAPGDAVASSGDALAADVPGHKRQRRQGSRHGGVPRTPTSSVNDGNLSTSPGIGYDPGDDAAPQGIPRDSGNRHAHQAKPEGVKHQLDTRAASHSALSPLEQHLRCVDAFVHDANVYVHHQAVDLDELQLRADWVESPKRFTTGLWTWSCKSLSFLKRVRTGSQTWSVKSLSCTVILSRCCVFSSSLRDPWLRHLLLASLLWPRQHADPALMPRRSLEQDPGTA
ncbi:hypothetical protein PI125_g21488 [Phytophthora idaei]|nr:hypothetical protein PI125_g21488 [Phytophthora idaei]KAG3142462.1 hypothetical protein PI126_g15037 [Phytophthora idaei]